METFLGLLSTAQAAFDSLAPQLPLADRDKLGPLATVFRQTIVTLRARTGPVIIEAAIILFPRAALQPTLPVSWFGHA